MRKYFIHASTEWSGTDEYDLIEAKDEEDADEQAMEIALDNYNSYSNIWEQEQEDAEEGGFDWIDGEHYEWSVEVYNPEKHNGYLNDSELKEDA